MRALTLAACALVAGCFVQRFEHDGVASLEVKLVTPAEGSRGTSENRLDTPSGTFTVKVAVTAFDRSGQPMDCADGHGCFEGLVSFGVSPGFIPIPNPLFTQGGDYAKEIRSPRGGTTLKLSAGKGEKELKLRGVFSEVHVWAEEWPEVVDGEIRPARYAAGVSEPLWFKNPSLQNLQYDPATMGPQCRDLDGCDNSGSPLAGNFVESRESTYLVTNITNEGFFVADLGTATTAKPIATLPGNFATLFVYNFSYPDNLVVGDIVTRLYGTVQDFSGQTQTTFPAWDKQPEELTFEQGYTRTCSAEAACPAGTRCESGRCRVIPIVVNEALCGTVPRDGTGPNPNKYNCSHSTSRMELESLESARIEIEATMPTSFVNCDRNGDGDTPNPSFNLQNQLSCLPTDEECLCRYQCMTTPGCSETSALHTYGQYSVTLPGVNQMKINVLTRDSSPTVVPNQPSQEDADTQRLVYGGVKVRVRGNLRQTLAARPRWTVVAGERADFCCLETGTNAARCREIPPCE